MSPYLLAITTLLLFSAAIAVGVYLGQVFASTSNKKWKGSIETDITSLSLELERVRNLLKSLSNRTALADFKAKQREEKAASSSSSSTEGMTKEQLRAKFLRGSHVDIARRAMSGDNGS